MRRQAFNDPEAASELSQTQHIQADAETSEQEPRPHLLSQFAAQETAAENLGQENGQLESAKQIGSPQPAATLDNSNLETLQASKQGDLDAHWAAGNVVEGQSNEDAAELLPALADSGDAQHRWVLRFSFVVPLSLVTVLSSPRRRQLTL